MRFTAGRWLMSRFTWISMLKTCQWTINSIGAQPALRLLAETFFYLNVTYWQTMMRPEQGKQEAVTCTPSCWNVLMHACVYKVALGARYADVYLCIGRVHMDTQGDNKPRPAKASDSVYCSGNDD
jgi:hypothetical protein